MQKQVIYLHSSDVLRVLLSHIVGKENLEHVNDFIEAVKRDRTTEKQPAALVDALTFFPETESTTHTVKTELAIGPSQVGGEDWLIIEFRPDLTR